MWVTWDEPQASTYQQPGNEASCIYELVDAIRVCCSIRKVRVRSEVRLVLKSGLLTIRSTVITWLI